MQVPAADSLPTLDELIASPPISLKYNRAPPAAADYYAALGLAVDFSEDELKQAYKKQSRAHHPDRAGGSDEAFQLIAAANTCLSDPLCRAAYNEGEGTKRELLSDGSEGPTLKERVERHYFPERFPLQLFGDPFERKRQWEAEVRANAPLEDNADDIPPGPYTDSCHGCSLSDGGRVLRCTQCRTVTRSTAATSIAVGACSAREEIDNNDGQLTCRERDDADALPSGHEL